jgi:hypothetical protein
MSKQRAGAIVVIVSGLVFLAALSFLPYASRPRRTLWALTTRLPIILTVIAALAIAFALLGLLTGALIPTLLATCCSFYLFGQFFPDGARAYHGVGDGFWLATSATVVMSIGGVIAVSSFANRSAKPS